MWKQRKITFSHVARAASQESHSFDATETSWQRFRLLLGEINEWKEREMPFKCSLVDVPRQESGAFETKLN